MSVTGFVVLSILSGVVLILMGAAVPGLTGRERASSLLGGIGMIAYALFVSVQTSGTYYYSPIIFIIPAIGVAYLVVAIVRPDEANPPRTAGPDQSSLPPWLRKRPTAEPGPGAMIDEVPFIGGSAPPELKKPTEAPLEPFALVNRAVDSLVPYLPDIATQAEAGAPQVLYRTVAVAVGPHMTREAFDEYVRHPGDNTGVKRILRALVRNSPSFAAELADALDGLSR
jgi:hypothetical protein